MPATLTSVTVNSGGEHPGSIVTETTNTLSIHGTGLTGATSVTLSCSSITFSSISIVSNSGTVIGATFSANSTALGPQTVVVGVQGLDPSDLSIGLSTMMWYPTV